MKSVRALAKGSITVLIIAIAVIQFVPVDRTNPPVETEVPATADARAVLRRACYDCHSNETIWPWYSRIAPISWLVASDVHEGREELNFSTWNRLAAKEQIKAMQKSREEVEEGEMPPWIYLLPHPDSRLTASDKAILSTWSRSVGGSIPLTPATRGTDQGSRRS